MSIESFGVSCELCGGSWVQIGTETAPGAERDAGQPAKFPLLRCSHCRTIVLNLPQVHLAQYLAACEFNDPSQYSAIFSSRMPYLQWLVRCYLADLAATRETRILDFGASFGLLGNWLSGLGYSVVGVEPNGQARSMAAVRTPQMLLVEDLEALASRESQFDAIVAVDSLYYVESPGAVLKRMAKLLKPGGRLVLRSTNGIFRSALHRFVLGFGFARREIGDARWGFSVSGLQTAIEAAGLELSGIRFWERGRRGMTKASYYLVSGMLAELFGGALPIAPGFILTAVRPLRSGSRCRCTF